jgi:hypothetical protein
VVNKIEVWIPVSDLEPEPKLYYGSGSSQIVSSFTTMAAPQGNFTIKEILWIASLFEMDEFGGGGGGRKHQRKYTWSENIARLMPLRFAGRPK